MDQLKELIKGKVKPELVEFVKNNTEVLKQNPKLLNRILEHAIAWAKSEGFFEDIAPPFILLNEILKINNNTMNKIIPIFIPSDVLERDPRKVPGGIPTHLSEIMYQGGEPVAKIIKEILERRPDLLEEFMLILTDLIEDRWKDCEGFYPTIDPYIASVICKAAKKDPQVTGRFLPIIVYFLDFCRDCASEILIEYVEKNKEMPLEAVRKMVGLLAYCNPIIEYYWADMVPDYEEERRMEIEGLKYLKEGKSRKQNIKILQKILNANPKTKEEIISTIFTLIDDVELEVQCGTIYALAEIGKNHPETVNDAISLLTDKMTELTAPEYIDLKKRYEKKDYQYASFDQATYQYATAFALSELLKIYPEETENILPSILTLLKDEFKFIRISVILMLDEIIEVVPQIAEKIVNPIIELIKTENNEAFGGRKPEKYFIIRRPILSTMKKIEKILEREIMKENFPQFDEQNPQQIY